MFSFLPSLFQRTVIERPLASLLLVLSCALLLALGLPNFKLDASADSLTLEHDRDVDYFREIFSRYQSGDFLVITYTPKVDLFSDQSLRTLAELRDDLSEIEGVASVQSMLDLPLLYSPMRSLSEIKAETRTLATAGVDREQAKREFHQSPIYRDMILSPSGQTTAVLLNIAVDNTYIDLVRQRDALRYLRDDQGLTTAQEQELVTATQVFLDYRTAAQSRSHARVNAVRNVVATYRDRAELFLGGVTMITADMVDFIKSDLVVFGCGILLFIVLTLWAIFRQARFVFLPLVVCLLTVVMVLGWLSWIDWRLTVISSNFVALLLIMTLAINIHLVVRFRELHAQNPSWTRAQLVAKTVHFMARPCLYSALTTIVAFVSLVVSDIRPVIDFGWMMTIGLSLALLLSFIVLPAGLMLLPLGQSRDKGDNSAALTLRFSRFAEQRGLLLIVLTILTAAISVFGISRLEVENRFIDYFHESTEIYQGMSVIDQELGGTTTLEIILDAAIEPQERRDFEDPFSEADAVDELDPFDEPDPFEAPESLAEEDPFAEADPFSENSTETLAANQPSYWFTGAGLDEIDQLHRYLESRQVIGKVQSLATAYSVASDLNGSQLNDFELAVLRQSLPAEVKGFLIDPYLSAEHDQTRLTLRARETDSNLRRAQLIADIRNYAVNEIGLQPEQVHFTGMLVLYNNMLQSLFKSQIVTLGAVFIGIMLMFLVLFRSISIALIALIPNMLAAAVVMGGMGLAGIPLDMMTITIAAITVGVGVDHAIHYLHRYKREFAIDGDYAAAMHRSHASIGRAMYYTSVTIIIGFSILALSKFIPSIYFGLLTALAMFAAILGSLTLLPKLILWLKPFGAGQAD